MSDKLRATKVKAGLNCEGVRLQGVAIDCCPQCHDPTFRQHEPSWVNIPHTEKVPDLAYVCCRFWQKLRLYYQKGAWPTQVSPQTSLAASIIQAHPSWVTSYLPPVVKAKYYQKTSTNEYVTISTSFSHHYYNQDLLGGTEPPVKLCKNAECIPCSESLHLYWSWSLQAWMPLIQYALLDNAWHLSPTHDHPGAHHGKCVPNCKVHQGKVYVPEYAAFMCPDLQGPWFALNPMFAAAIVGTGSPEWVVHLYGGPFKPLQDMAKYVHLVKKVVNH